MPATASRATHQERCVCNPSRAPSAAIAARMDANSNVEALAR
jgi:hypothetical protein